MSDEARDRSLANLFIKANVLHPYRLIAENALQALHVLRTSNDISDESVQPVQTLMKRWTQIEVMVKEALDSVENEEKEITQHVGTL